MEEKKQRFIELLKSTNRDGIDILINWLNNATDFFEAPASSNYHNSFEGGLLEHSLNVYYNLLEEDSEYKEDTLIIVSLLHDICKANYYISDERNVKKVIDGISQWVKEPYYKVNDEFPIGHGEKSVIIIQNFIKLSEEEIAAIRWHMGGFDNKENYTYISKSFNKYPLAIKLHIADLKATYLTENNIDSYVRHTTSAIEKEYLENKLIKYTDVVEKQGNKIKKISDLIHKKIAVNEETGAYYYTDKFNIDDLKNLLDIVDE